MGAFTATLQTMQYLQEKKDPALQMPVSGAVAGFLAGGFSSLLDRHHGPVTFQGSMAVKGMAVCGTIFGVLGYGMAKFIDHSQYHGVPSFETKVRKFLFPPPDR
jgi:hypothetical protein